MESTNRMDRWSFKCFLAGVFFITFSIALGEAMLLLALLFLAAGCVRQRRIPAFPLAGWILLFVTVAILTATLGINPEKGVFRLKRLFWFSVVPLSAVLVSNRGRLLATLKAFALGCGILFLDAGIRKPIWVLQKMQDGHRYAGLSFREALTKRGSMTDGEMLMLGVIASLGIFLALSRDERRRAGRWLVLAALQLLAVFINFKRGAWVCTGFFVAIMVAVYFNRKTLMVLLLVMMGVAWTPWAQERFAETAEQLDPHHGARWAMWTRVAPKMIEEYPRGVGYGAVNNRLMRKYWRYIEPGRSHLHNNMLQVLVETGWLGFAIYIAWMLHFIVNATRLAVAGRRWRPGEGVLAFTVLLMVLAVLSHGLVEYNFGDAELLIVLCVLMGITGRHRVLAEVA